MADRTCSVEDCYESVWSRNRCRRHYQLWWESDQFQHYVVPTCSECERKAHARGWCRKHYRAWQKYGDPLGVGVIGAPRRDRIAYSTAHKRVYRDRGKASDYVCGDCGEQAEDWAYNGPVGGWSPDPYEYTALCRSCHHVRDGKVENLRR